MWRIGKWQKIVIQTQYISSTHQFEDIPTQPLEKTRLDFICNKLGMYDVYVAA